MSFSAAVIGLGNIGLEYDYDDNSGAKVLTHANGFHHHSAFQLVAGVDPSPQSRKRFEDKFKLPAYSSMEDLLNKHKPEVFSIGVPTPQHFDLFKQVVAAKPKAIICEKPIASNIQEATEMNRLAKEANCLLLVNYMRRFEPGLIKLKTLIANKVLGEIFKGTIWYSKGILNNGSHFIDLLSFCLGDVSDLQVIQRGRNVRAQDPEPDIRIRFGSTDIYFLAGREECFSYFELELMGTKGLVKYSKGGEEIRVLHTKPDELYPTYTILNDPGEKIPTNCAQYQIHVLDALHAALSNGAAISSNGHTAQSTLQVIEKIKSLMSEGKNV